MLKESFKQLKEIFKNVPETIFAHKRKHLKNLETFDSNAEKTQMGLINLNLLSGHRKVLIKNEMAILNP